MIPILYQASETAFNTNGIGRLRDCISCKVTEERNGKYECEFQYPVTGRRFKDIEEGCFVSVTHDDNHDRQPFRIYRKSAPLNGVVTFNARHISYDLNNIILQPFTGTSVTATFAQINGKSINTNPFAFWTDKTTVADFTLDHPASVRSILGGVRGSILDVYGGEYQFDGLTVKLYNNRGVDTDITLRYGKNIIDIDQTKDSGEIYDACVPFWSQDDVLVTVSGYIVRQGQTANRIVALDMTQMFDEQPTEADLRSAAQSYLNNNKPWVPKENIKIDFVALWQTDRYKDVAVLQRVKLCDTVNVYVPHLGITIDNVKVVKVVYNVLANRYDEIELGEARSTFAQTLTSEIKSLVDAATRNIVSKSVLEAEIARNTQLITGGLGGHVVYKLNANGQPEEILVMDTDNIQTAVHVWRWNQGGFAHSSNGYNGPFSDIALTADGHINASMITVGTLSANLIRAGVISDAQGKSYWDLDSGLLNLVGDMQILKGTVSAKISDVDYYSVNLNTGVITTLTDPGFEIATVSNADNSKIAWVARKVSSTYYSLSQRRERRGGTTIDPLYFNLYAGTGTDSELIHHGKTYLRQFNVANGEQRTFIDVDAVKKLYTAWESTTSYGYRVTDPDHNDTWAEFMCAVYEYDGSGRPSSAYRPFFEVRIGDTSNNMTMHLHKDRFWIATGKPGTATNSYVFSVLETATCIITGNGALINGKTVAYTSTSSRRYKEAIKPVENPELDPHRLYQLEVKQFKYHDGMILQYDDMAFKEHVGFIAEEVDEIYPDAVIHNGETGQVESWDERRIIPPMLKLIQEQKQKIDELEKRIERLENLMKG